MTDDWTDIGCDFKVVFIHHKPEEIVEDAHSLLQDSLAHDHFLVEGERWALVSVAQPSVFNPTDKNGTDVEELEPRIEFYIGIIEKFKAVGCIFVLEHLLNCLRENQNRNTQLLYLRYRIEFRPPVGIDLPPFKRHLSASDSTKMRRILLGNVIWHNQLYVRRTVKPNMTKMKDILGKDVRHVEIPCQSSKQPKTSGVNNGGERTVGQSFNSEIGPKQRVKKEKKHEQLQLPDGRIVDLGMKAEFEHDRQQLSLTFFLTYQDKRTWPSIDKYKMEIQYSSILCVLMTLKRKGRTRFGAQLLLRTQYPPTVWATEDFLGLKDRVNNRDKRMSRGKRVLCWKDPSGGMGSKEAVEDDLKDCPVIVLELNSMQADDLSALISRFMVQLKQKVELRNLDEVCQLRRPQIELSSAFYDNPELFYWIEALSTRGYVVMDHWTEKEEREDFFENLVLNSFKEDRDRTLEALEMLADKLLDRAEIKHCYGLGGMLKDILAGVSKNRNYVQPLRDGFERVKKVVITPSRIIPCGHEILMGNRALRFDRINFPPDKFLRVIFRDENWERIHKNQVNGWLLEKFVMNRLLSGISLAGQVYSFVGTSNSQMRDGGCYFLQTDLEGAHEFRNRLGQFSLVPTIPKMMSRLGLCFTQGRETEVDMRSRMLAWDFTGLNSQSDEEPYNFSDGCGCLSLAAARKISFLIGIDEHNTPSCFQFRYAGYKGVLAVNPVLDQNKQFLYDVVVDPILQDQEEFLAVDFLFRPSQKKFEVWKEYEDECRFDVVKCSAPTSVVLNKPLINIFDQVSELQSTRCHKRICDRIHSLLDRHIFSVCATLTDEVFARRRLQELPRLIDYGAMNSVQFTREPFFRLVLRAAARVAIHRVCQKLAIAIPPELSRMMFGVIDETGILQYGQVFVQYTIGIDGTLTETGWRNRKPQNGPSKKRILTGQVLITKNPSVVGGDVRMFEAVDIVALHHLVDVLVFPRYGPRPHSDEMAGSDLDGDEYTIIWDEELMLDDTQPAADYSAPKGNPTKTENLSPDEYQAKMAAFIVSYLDNDSVGQISNSHLANSDLYGINSDVCSTIARKHSQAVDFPKTGLPPKKLTVQWNELADIPPEKYERTPDFMGKARNEPHYVSSRLNAQLYRRIKTLSDFLNNTIGDESVQLPNVDELMLSEEEHHEYLELAAGHYQKYAYSIRSLMDSYGILCEGELFSSSYSSLCNRISDRENDDMSFFTTSRVIEQRLWDIRMAARKTFFASFGSDMDSQTDEEGICREPSDRLKCLARAYYTIGYNSVSRKLLSFPWVASWDVLDSVRRSRMLSSIGRDGTGDRCSRLFSSMFDSFGERVSEHIKAFVSAKKVQLNAFTARWFGIADQPMTQNEEDKSEIYAIKQLLSRYVLRHDGLAQLMFFCVSWADHLGLFKLSPLREEHICLLLLSAGLTNQPQSVINSEERRPWLTETPIDWVESEETPCRAVTRLGRRFTAFIESLSSRNFEQMHCLDFKHLDLAVPFMFMGEWRELHRIALKTYYSLVFMDNDLHVLPSVDKMSDAPSVSDVDDGSLSVADQTQTNIRQGEVFVIELPCRIESEYMLRNSKLRVQLCAQNGCHEVILRRSPKSMLLSARSVHAKAPHSSAVVRAVPKPIRVLVSSWGSREALDRLRQFFAVRPQLDLSSNRRSRIQILPEETFEKLDKLTNGVSREREERLSEEASIVHPQGDDGVALEAVDELEFLSDEADESDVMSD